MNIIATLTENQDEFAPKELVQLPENQTAYQVARDAFIISLFVAYELLRFVGFTF